ncbi:aspartate dehydrogenase [Pseudomonas sp. H3(2019)]|uniref:aspartate dehydrogenase n=1 Tax=Pseudomonas sp. H3(2019) TaxID=2598724 RepID=UPI0011908DC0|nr:aspartate dehydrogenase [Pseudomonas sp. H3(2019)]TVT84319.1 aspartate dehydrogenase [Pseudomonas sp. H3(2019)]
MTTSPYSSDLRIGIVGLGAVGVSLARAFDAGIPGIRLVGVTVRNPERAAGVLAYLKNPPALLDLDELALACDVVIECAPAALLPKIALPVLSAGKKLVVLSSSALLDNPHLIDLARLHGGQILVPSGALLGLDAVTAAAEGVIHSVRMITRKPPHGLAGAPYLLENCISIEGLDKPKRVFSGSAREAARGFPANLNVVVALSLAGIGPDRTTLEIWADPTVTRNTHLIEVDADSARLTMTIENIPSDNPKTGRITAQSVVALLRKMNAPLRIGT